MVLRRFETWLTQYLDSLPKSDRPSIGARYAMAGAAAVAAVGFGIVQGILSGVGVAAIFGSAGSVTNPLVIGGIAVSAAASWLMASGVSLAVVIPGGFVGGVIWRFVPESLRLGGLVGGLLSTLVGYAVSCAILFPLGVLFSIAVDPSLATATDSLLELALLLGFISLYTSWATVPVGGSNWLSLRAITGLSPGLVWKSNSRILYH